MMRTRAAWVLVLVWMAVLIASSLAGCGAEDPHIPVPEAAFVGREVCAKCHEPEQDLWSGSHHDLAMQIADAGTVLGDFDDSTFTHFGVTSTFSNRDGRFYVRTEGPDGALVDYQVKYTFGVTPLQQYLIEFPGGRLQALSISWDTRPASAGGQKWFHVYGDEEITHDDELHWTGRNQNWNYMCAECHSTNLQKNYNQAFDRYETTWSEINVSCEACHGPASHHVEWAEAVARGETAPHQEGMGLQIALKDPDQGIWVFEPDATTAKRVPPRSANVQVESCARCHSRRSTLRGDYVHGRPLLDTHLPSLLEEHLYHADGQILDEVYVYGSFLQSKMHQQGVTCSDCHEPHGLGTIATGNNLCSRCHLPESYDTPSHHFHTPDSTGSSCVECHMPAKTYMVVDPRRDHSIRIPRPDLSVRLGTPNACTGCHDDQSPQWAVDRVLDWYGSKAEEPPHFAESMQAARAGEPRSEQALSELVMDSERPGIVRASALTLLGRFRGASVRRTIVAGVKDEDPLLRIAALIALEDATAPERLAVAFGLLRDPILGVRVRAVGVLAFARPTMTRAQGEIFDHAAEEYIAAQLVNADQPSAHANLGNYYFRVGKRADSEAAFLTAIRLDPMSVLAYGSLSNLYRAQNRDDRGEEMLREALQRVPASAELHQALGLLLVRRDRKEDGLASLRTAAFLDPNDARFAYVYGIGLNDAGEVEASITVLQRAYEQHPYDRDILWALATIHRDLDRRRLGLQYARVLTTLAPEVPAYAQLLRELEGDR